MELDITWNLRNLFFAAAFLTTATVCPGFSEPFIKPALRVRLALRRLGRSFRNLFEKRPQNSFWEVDLTKIEP